MITHVVRLAVVDIEPAVLDVSVPPAQTLELVGPIGPAGSAGSAGLPGPIGPTGAVGPPGASGARGDPGLVGPTGVAGQIGPAGPKGDAGVNGTNGAAGPTGPQGSQGVKGDTGATGPVGGAGAPGAPGATGAVGPTGAAGAVGATGAAGGVGPIGPAGPQGPAGAIGTTGTTGAAGAAGAGYAGSSTSTLAIGTGAKVVTIAAGLAYVVGQRVRVANSATAYMEGPVASYTGSTLTVTVDRVVGSGTFSVWTIGVAGDPGAGAVNSVNGLTGTVVIPAGVTSVNGRTGAVVVPTPVDTTTVTIGGVVHEVLACDFVGVVTLATSTVDGSIWAPNLAAISAGSEALNRTLRSEPDLEQTYIALRLHGGGVLEAYDARENVILEAVPRIPVTSQVLGIRMAAAIPLTQWLGVIGWGQSNAEGGGYASAVSATPFYAANALTFTNGPRPDITPANFNGSTTLFETTLVNAGTGSTPGGESPCTGFASRFLEDGVRDGNWSLATAPTVFASTAGWSGQDITRFFSTGFVYPRLGTHVAKQKALAVAAGKTYSVPFFFWVQGESDAEGGLKTRAERLAQEQLVYTDAVATIRSNSGQTYDPIEIFAQINYGSRRPSNPGSIALAQYDFHDGQTRVCAGPTYQYPFNDLFHPNAVGRRLLGEQMGRVAKLVAVDNRMWTGLRPRNAFARGTEVFVRFHVPQGPLALDTTFVAKTRDFGFRVIDGVGAKTVTDVRLISADTIKLTVSTPVSGATTVRYALDYLYDGAVFDPLYGASGNVRDSDRTRVTIGSTNYFLWNWCVAFQMTCDLLQPAVT